MTEEGDKYIREIKEAIKGYSDKMKIEVLTEKVLYWYQTARGWCESYELERGRLTQMKEKEGKKMETKEVDVMKEFIERDAQTTEELIFALAESNIDRAASDEIIDKLEGYEKVQEELRSVYKEWLEASDSGMGV